MSHHAEHHIEHAEHAAHAAHDTFNTRVTISIAIIAAALAAVSIMGHKAHNYVLQRQIEASMLKGEAFNKWAQFQAYNIRSHFYQVALDEVEYASSKPESGPAVDKAISRWKSQVDKYENKSMPESKVEAKEFDRRAHELTVAALEWHHKAERLDLGDLGLQLGVVLASLAILTKLRAFWFAGMASAVIGFSIAMTGQFGLLMSDHGHEHPPAAQGHVDHHDSHPPAKH